jgi:hypothetical protein
MIAAAFVAVELAVSGRYGFMQDELYFLVAGHHLAFGYVDQPPIAPLLTRITGLLGVNPTAIRIVPALAGGAVVTLAARQAALFGAGRSGQVLAALAMACAPVLLGADHLANTTPLDLLAWTVVVCCVTTALLQDRPHWWLGAGIAAGLGLESDNLVLLLLIALGAGIVLSPHRPVLGTRWPWLGFGIAMIIWAPNLAWQGAHGWPQLAMSSALRRDNSSTSDYAAALPIQLVNVGLLLAPLVVVGMVGLWRSPQLRFLGIATALVVVYVVVWIPGKSYYTDGLGPAVLAAGATVAERWATRRRRPNLWRRALFALPLAGVLVIMPLTLPIVPVADVHDLSTTVQHSSQVGDEIGWTQLTAAVVAQEKALSNAGEAPTSIFAGYYGEAAALQVLGEHDHLPPVLSGQNAYWMWGPGKASDRTVLVIDALGQLRAHFARCRVLTTYRAPYRVQNDWTDLQIGVCTVPAAGWHAFWSSLKRYE